MSKLYNTQSDISSLLENFFHSIIPDMRKTQLNILPSIIFGMILSESVVSSDIASKLKDDFSFVHHSSVVKRIYRFLHNTHFDIYSFYDSVIQYIISNYRVKHPDGKVHIVFDHMYMRDHFSILLFSLRIGNQSIPLWFRTFKGDHNPQAFYDSLIIKGIDYVSHLFENTNYRLIFLADRWFNSTRVLSHIDFLHHTFYIRVKSNLNCQIFIPKEGHFVRMAIALLPSYQCHSAYYPLLLYTEKNIPFKAVVSKRQGYEEPWIILTNGDVKVALKEYSYRFGGIECLFKNQKSNGFYLEATSMKDSRAFSTLFGLVCFSVLMLTVLGCDYTKNNKCYRNLKIESTKKYKNGGLRRVISLFKIGLLLFNKAFNSSFYVRFPNRFILYDV